MNSASQHTPCTKNRGKQQPLRSQALSVFLIEATPELVLLQNSILNVRGLRGPGRETTPNVPRAGPPGRALGLLYP